MMKLAVFGIFCALLYLYFSEKENLTKDFLEEEYDYVVVGAGSAGSVLASRLSEDGDKMVAVVEAGPDNDDHPETSIPGMALLNLLTAINWMYPTTQKMKTFNGMAEEKRKHSYHAGRILGGGSSLNFMVAARGSRHDYDLWEAMGNEGWGYKDVLPYFKKLERVTNQDWIRSGYRGAEGLVGVEEAHHYPIFLDSFLKGAKSVGVRVTSDYNGKEGIGASKAQLNVEGGIRQSTAIAFLKPVMRRPNLHVITKAHATKVLFEGKKAVGIEYLHDGRMKRVRARKEVILSAGNWGSPKLLLLSGVGPKDHLTDMKIPVVADLPVGQNIQEHMGTDALSYTYSPEVVWQPSFIDELKYKIFRTGPLSSSAVIANVFHYSEHQPQHLKYPYMQLLLFATLFKPDETVGNGFKTLFNLNPEGFHEAHAEHLGKPGVSVLPILLHSNSRMSLKLNSTNPFDEAVIDSRFLSDDADVKIMADGIKAAVSIMESQPLKEIGSKALRNIDPKCKAYEYDSEDYWRCYIHRNIFSCVHATGSCMMGRKDDPQAVVDAQLRVHGIEGLRVVDISVMPEVPSGNTNFPAMMVGEKAADMIRGIKP